MNESDTRLKKIDPALKEAGWGVVEGAQIFTEQRAYQIAPGRIERLSSRNPLKIDYLLTYRGQKIGIIEAKKDELDVSAGVEQAKQYADMMKIRHTYSTNGDEIYAIDMETGKEGLVDRFPTPDELWQKVFPDVNPWRDKFNAYPFNRDGGKQPRYYQEIAVNKALEAFANHKQRILLTLATGTGKTYIAFQIAWKLFQTRWNLHNEARRPRILFLADRNILANQALNDFGQFDENAICRITPAEAEKMNGRMPKGRSLYFTIFQTFMCQPEYGKPYYKQYEKDFFDLIIIDECHRGGANDESQWREILEYFKPACQLGLTATPKRNINTDTYKYFGEPVYQYSLKQGIEDGYLTPYRVRISESPIDEYVYSPDQGDQVIAGEVHEGDTFDESDFYNGKIYIRQRDEMRVKEFLDKINADEKTIVFCATQNHAAQVRDMINQFSKKPNAFYCVRVTADDGEQGEQQLKKFQDNEKTIPTMLTTSQKLSTGVDARNVRNIVLMRPVRSIIEFKQIIGRGTRLFDDKYYFTIYDFVGAYHNFEDPEWDGEPLEPTPPKEKPEKPKPDIPDQPKPCPICGNSPCTCPGGSKPRNKVEIRLSPNRIITIRTGWNWDERFMFDGKLITMDEFIKNLFGRLPAFFNSQDDLHHQWANPTTRKALLEQLEREGFVMEKLKQVQYLVSAEDCDLLDVLEFLAYHTTPMERKRRVALVKEDILHATKEAQKPFIDFVLQQYIEHGVSELSLDNLPELIKLKYGTVSDAVKQMGVINSINQSFVQSQSLLYAV